MGITLTLPTGLRKRSSSRNFDSAFTLIEIMIVLTLIVILSSIAMPSLRGFTASSRLKSSVHGVRDMLRFARDMSITERSPYLVVFDFELNKYWLASSDTFEITDPSASSIASPSSTVIPVINQQRLEGESSVTGRPMISRTSNILGLPQSLGKNVTLSRMITNHNFQSRQVDSGVDYIYFSPTGSSEETTLYIQNLQGKLMSITVEGATGRIHTEGISSQQAKALGHVNTEEPNLDRD